MFRFVVFVRIVVWWRAVFLGCGLNVLLTAVIWCLSPKLAPGLVGSLVVFSERTVIVLGVSGHFMCIAGQLDVVECWVDVEMSSFSPHSERPRQINVWQLDLTIYNLNS